MGVRFWFAVVRDRLTDEIRQEAPWSENREQVEESLEKWRHALERRRRVKAIRSKTAYVSVNERKTDITGDAGRMSRCWITVFFSFST